MIIVDTQVAQRVQVNDPDPYLMITELGTQSPTLQNSCAKISYSRENVSGALESDCSHSSHHVARLMFNKPFKICDVIREGACLHRQS